jgi:hypothetical protein
MVEITAEEYDECVEKATTVSFDAEGEEKKEVDQQLLFRLMAVRSLTEPSLSMADLMKVGSRLVRQLERDVRDLHFEVEPLTPSKKPRAKKGDEKEEESPNEPGA